MNLHSYLKKSFLYLTLLGATEIFFLYQKLGNRDYQVMLDTDFGDVLTSNMHASLSIFVYWTRF